MESFRNELVLGARKLVSAEIHMNKVGTINLLYNFYNPLIHK